MMRALTLLGPGLVAFACESSPTHPLNGDDGSTGGPRDAQTGGGGQDASVHVGPPVPVDVLFVLQNSGSMSSSLRDRLVHSLPAFIEALTGAADYRVAVVTTDAVNGIERAGTAASTYSMTSPFELTGGFSDMFCGWCTFYNAPDCCEAIVNTSPLIGEPGRYVEFARMMEARIVASDPTIPMTQCKGGAVGPRAACLVESICQDDYGPSFRRIVDALVLAQ